MNGLCDVKCKKKKTVGACSCTCLYVNTLAANTHESTQLSLWVCVSCLANTLWQVMSNTCMINMFIFFFLPAQAHDAVKDCFSLTDFLSWALPLYSEFRCLCTVCYVDRSEESIIQYALLMMNNIYLNKGGGNYEKDWHIVIGSSYQGRVVHLEEYLA